MATPGKKLDEHTRAQIVRLRDRGVSISEIARRLMLCRPTVQKILRNGVDKFSGDGIQSR